MFAFITRLRPAPLALGLFFTLVTGRVLFDDVIASTLPLLQAVTTAHVLTLAGIVAAIASGHYAIAEFRRWHLLTGSALAVLFVAATGYITVASGGRNAEQAAVKVVHATDIAEKRAAAKSALEKAEAAHTAAVTYWTTQRDAATAECKSGEGTKCRGARSNESAALTAAEKASGAVKDLRSTYDALKPAPPANAGYAHFAKIVSAFTGADIEATTAKIALAMPFVIVLVTELATIVFLHMGLAPMAHSFPNPDTLSPAEIEDARKVLSPPSNDNIIEHPVLKALREAGRPLTNDELAEAMAVSKGESSKRRREVADRLLEKREGRYLMVAAR